MKLDPGQAEPPSHVISGPHASRVDQPPDGWRLWWLAIRPKTLSISVAPVVAGTALAWGDGHTLDLRPFAASLLGALAIQAGTNLYNDVGDALRGGDQPLRQGPPRVTALGWASPERVKRAALACFALAALVGLYLAWRGGWPIIALGLASLAAGWAYSGGPRPIAYTPTGEAFVIAFFGIGAVGGTYYLQTLHLTGQSIMVGAALGAVAAAVLLANNYRDMEPDRLAGRRTLAIRIGAEASKAVYGMLLLSPIALLASPLGPKGGWLCLVALPMALWLILRFATRARGPAFNAILAATAQFQLLLAGLVGLGILL
ncbi:1 4-dihydroxy-2-naphthoate polyprenyltransferase [Paramagnetospirillum magnetotacticum MS-1]|uniref:1,4-dihydroxy-2-naphthoate octaprenyltransferase n=1 Tax=Paramagnetospirillum magnetotacticum MS-1 TaxID=272627 RepID=A0A0C2V4V6_PARME|nr:1,4-dihydroxy-2-naphthoate octaprenyltransferase [Paramagnetospirillum magnetotacticum]KIM00087.1 1 4-dihydroxy-2-naphthoate polyprenyltransferase [Paramagnetospirillum magnetotacticum MS-1]